MYSIQHKHWIPHSGRVGLVDVILFAPVISLVSFGKASLTSCVGKHVCVEGSLLTLTLQDFRVLELTLCPSQLPLAAS